MSYKRTEKEFWTNKQRQACSIHEVSYRACFKPQLPKYFIDKYDKENLKSFFGGISERLNFEYSDHNLEIFGFCNTCK